MKTIVLLHGAIGASDQLEKLKEGLSENFKVYAIDFFGHGLRSSENMSFSIENFAADLDVFLTKNEIMHPVIFGYSMGGYVAVYHAIHFSNKAEKIITLGTKFNWNSEVALKESQMLNPKKIMEKVPQFAQQLQQRHGENYWEKVLSFTAGMMLEMGRKNPLSPDDFVKLEIPACYGLGDRDTMVTLEETYQAYKHSPKGSFYVLPDTPHPIEKINWNELIFRIYQFAK